MKKSEAMDLYEGLNEISPQMIEEAGNYKKTASVFFGAQEDVMINKAKIITSAMLLFFFNIISSLL